MAMKEKRLRELFDAWVDRLGLGHYHLRLDVKACSSTTAYMEIERSTYDRGLVSVQPWLVGKGEPPDDVMEPSPDEEFIEASIVHELLHLHTRVLRAIVHDDLEGQVHPHAYTVLEAAAERAEEQLVDRLAVALVKAWPR